ncbi:MAG TPA: TRAP transporter small permease [Firmicutes bacterium]|nr:TRAP transporter small permease [Candidatus Fermentithermobacillaceae bacterium]
MAALARFNEKLSKAVDVACAVLIFVLFALVTFQVLNRFILRLPAIWTEEFARYLFVWTSLFGTVKGFRSKSHLGIDMLTMKLKGKTSSSVAFLAYLLVLVFFVLLAATGLQYAIRSIPNKNDTGAISMFWVYLGIPVSSVLCISFVLQDLADKAKEVFSR